MAYDANRLDKAVEAYDEALSLRRYLLKQAPRDLQAQRALSLALERLADVREDRGHRVRALDLYRESMGISVALASQDPKRFGLDLAITRKRVAELEAKINA
jgi:tetratricopeptide (TPR) repeat protein